MYRRPRRYNKKKKKKKQHTSVFKIPEDDNSFTELKKESANSEVETVFKIPEGFMELKKESANFEVQRAVCWKKFESVPFKFMAKALDLISNESNTTVITQILCNMLRTVIETTPVDLVAVMYLLSENIEPFYVYKSPLFLYRAINYIDGRFKDGGSGYKEDRSAEESRLSVVNVYETFKELNKCQHENYKMVLLMGLFDSATGCEQICLISLLRRMHKLTLRPFAKVPLDLLPLKEQTLLTALGHAALYSLNLKNLDTSIELEESKEQLEVKAAEAVSKVYSAVPVYDKLVHDLLLFGVWKLWDSCTITPDVPLRPMTSSECTGSVSEIFNKFKNRDFICEYDYPTQRSLIHYTEKTGQLELYDSHGCNITHMYLDVARAVLSLTSAFSFILDCYLVEHGCKEKEEKKEEHSICEVPDMIWPRIMDIGQVCIYASDILYLNGEQLLQKPLKDRRENLRRSFQEKIGVLQFAQASALKTPAALQYFFDGAVSLRCQQLLIKTEDSTYEPGSYSENWSTLEIDFKYDIPPILDLVPIASHPNGKDNYTFLLACYDSGKDDFQTIGTMDMDKQSKSRYRSDFKERFAKKENYKFHEKMIPTSILWYEPTKVWQVRGSLELSDSPPYHPAALRKWDGNKGFVFKNSQLVCVLDKDPKKASSPDKVVDLYGQLLSFQAYKHRKSMEPL